MTGVQTCALRSAIAIGEGAGYNYQTTGSIAISAAGVLATGNAGLYIDPIRNDITSTSIGLFYDADTKEITYNTVITPVPNALVNGSHSVTLDSDGALTGDGANGNFYIDTITSTGTTSTWVFGVSGALTLPDGTTAYGVNSVKSYGAVGNGVHNDTAAIQTAFTNANNKTIYFPPGDYLTTATLTLSGSGITVRGGAAGSTRIFCSAPTFRSLLLLGTCTNVHFEGITFEITGTDATESLYGVVAHQDEGLTDVSFTRCVFSSPYTNTNGVKLIAQSTNLLERVSFKECQFNNIQRMGVEIQNHNTATLLARYCGLAIDRCSFKNIGSTGTIGYAISLSGLGENNFITNNTFDNIKLGVELVGPNDTTVAFNKFRSFYPDQYSAAFGFVGGRIMYRNRVIGNTMESAQRSHSNLWNQDGMTMSDNQFSSDGDMAVWFRTISNVRSTNDTYDSAGVYAAYIEVDTSNPALSTSTNNQFVSCQFTTARSTSSFSVFRTYATGTTDTKLIACTITKGTGGALVDGYAGAEIPRVWDYRADGSLTLPGLLSAPTRTVTTSSTGTVGQMCWDADYIYVCTATNAWRRIGLGW